MEELDERLRGGANACGCFLSLVQGFRDPSLELHQGGDRGVEVEARRIRGHPLDRPVFQTGERRIARNRAPVRQAGRPPAELVHAVQEPPGAHDSFLRPLRLLLRRADEEGVETHGVRAVAVDELVRRDRVAARLGHLLDSAGGRIQLGDHSLVEEARERLLDRHQAHVLQDPANEARVQQVEDGVLDASDVLVDRHPVRGARGIDHPGGVRGVQEPQVIPGRVDEGIHRVGLAPRGPPAARAGDANEGLGLLEGISLGSPKRHVFRQEHRKIGVRDGDDPAAPAVNRRNRRPPVALARDQPVPQSVAHLSLPLASTHATALRTASGPLAVPSQSPER